MVPNTRTPCNHNSPQHGDTTQPQSSPTRGHHATTTAPGARTPCNHDGPQHGDAVQPRPSPTWGHCATTTVPGTWSPRDRDGPQHGDVTQRRRSPLHGHRATMRVPNTVTPYDHDCPQYGDTVAPRQSPTPACRGDVTRRDRGDRGGPAAAGTGTVSPGCPQRRGDVVLVWPGCRTRGSSGKRGRDGDHGGSAGPPRAGMGAPVPP